MKTLTGKAPKNGRLRIKLDMEEVYEALMTGKSIGEAADMYVKGSWTLKPQGAWAGNGKYSVGLSEEGPFFHTGKGKCAGFRHGEEGS